jgi:hypothetical protein
MVIRQPVATIIHQVVTANQIAVKIEGMVVEIIAGAGIGAGIEIEIAVIEKNVKLS